MAKGRKNIFALGLALCVFVCGNTFAYYENTDKENVEYENIFEIEAENYVSANDFQIIEDTSFSGGKGIKGSGDEKSIAEYEMNINGYATDLVIYVTHKATKDSGNLSMMCIDNFEYTPLYSNKIGEMVTTRIYCGELLGSHKLYIKNIRDGHMIDKITLKYNSRKYEKSENVDYAQGRPEVESMDIAEVKERTSGSFFFEAEDGITNDFAPYAVAGKDEGASGGLYWNIEAGAGEYLEPLADDRKGAQFKFYVSAPGTYYLWVRNFTPSANLKSTWFGIDNANYERVDNSSVGNWRWTKLYSRNLDVGWHTLEMKHRQLLHRVDCMVLTLISSFTPNGTGSLPGEPIIADESMQKNVDAGRAVSKFRTESMRMRSDVQFDVVGNEIYVPANNMAQILGIDYEIYDDYTIMKNGREYLKIYPDNRRCIASGRPIYLKTSPYMIEDTCMVPLSAVKKVFSFDYYYQKDENSLFVFSNIQDKYREANEGEIECISESDDSGAYVKIPHDNPNAEVEVWLRLNEDDSSNLEIANYDGLYKLISGGYTYNQHALEHSRRLKYMNWTKMSDTYYKDGAFWARRYEIYKGIYDFKVRIVENNKEDIFIARKAFKSTDKNHQNLVNNRGPEGMMKLAGTKTNGELLAISTFENIGLYIDTEFDNMDSCDFFYRKSGEETWNKAYKPFFDKQVKQFRGSIVNLQPNTNYECKAIIYDTNKKVLTEKQTAITTWNENPTVGKQLKLSDVYDGDGTLYLLDLEGTEDSWIEIDCEGKTIDAGINNKEAVYIGHCKYVIFKNAIIKGGTEHGISVNAKSENIRIINCDISDWGPGEGQYSDSLYVNYNNGEYYNYNGGIALYMTSNIVVERCYIHDPNMDTNEWYPIPGISEHPCGSAGLYLKNIRGLVIRYNNIIGGNDHRFNDVIEGFGNNGYYASGTGHDSDIYGNMMSHSNDDSIELDGAQMNVRFYKNRMEQSMVGISAAACTMGPSYIFNNIFTNIGDISGTRSSAIKAGGRNSASDLHIGHNFVFNNTFNGQRGMVNTGINGTSDYHSTTRNNIFLSDEGQTPYYNANCDERDDNDYDLYDKGREGSGRIKLPDEDGQHSIYETKPIFTDESKGDYSLTESSPGYDAGEILDNFTESYVGESIDMGAIEAGGDIKFIPYRPCDFSANTYSITLGNNEEYEVAVKLGEIKDAKSFRVVKNNEFDWIEVSENAEQITALSCNSEFKFTVKVDMEKCKFETGHGVILFMLDNGYAIPITVTGIIK